MPNLTVVVDDWEMGVTHVIRGDDHINNTPRQINILKALGAPLPEYAHVPMILGADGARLSKRHGAVSVLQYRDEGYLPQALLNYLVRLGWSHGDQEIFSVAEMIDLFDIDQVNASASTFNPDKLLWLNQHYIRTLPADELALHAAPLFAKAGVDTGQGPALATVLDIQRERAKTLLDMVAASRFFYAPIGEYDPKAAKKAFAGDAGRILGALADKLAALAQWQADGIHGAIDAICTEFDVGMGKVGMPLRVAVAGCGQSPAIDVTCEVLGRQVTLERITQAIDHIRACRDAAG